MAKLVRYVFFLRIQAVRRIQRNVVLPACHRLPCQVESSLLGVNRFHFGVTVLSDVRVSSADIFT